MRVIGLAVVFALGLVLAPIALEAEQAGMVPTIGFLFFNAVSDADNVACSEVVRQGLRELSWIEGRNIAFEARGADATPERLPGLADELARRSVKVIIATGNQQVAAAKRVGGGIIPVVCARTRSRMA